MGKFLRSLTDGTLRCRYCGDKDCDCMEDGRTQLEFCVVYKQTSLARLVRLKRQILPNGKKIPSGVSVWIPISATYGIDEVLKHIVIENSFINKMRFD